MSLVIGFVVGAVVGFVAGALVYRKNKKHGEALIQEGKDLIKKAQG